MRELSIAEAKRTLDYDPETGVFVKKLSNTRTDRIGQRADFKAANGYRAVNINDRRFQTHRITWLIVHGSMPVGQLDHINRIRDDNRIANLRLATQAEQNRNSVRKGASGYKGVFPCSVVAGKWRVKIKFQGKQIHLGSSPDILVAARMYDEAARQFFGPFAQTNFT